MSKTIWLKEHRALTPKRVGRSDLKAAALFLAPSFAGLLIFFLIPFADTVRRSFLDVRGVNFTGLSAYSSVVNNEAFQLASYNTARFLVTCIPLLLGFSLILALMIRIIRPRGCMLKTGFLLPMAIPVASIVLLWEVLFRPNGLLNSWLLSIGAEPVDFMGTSAAFWVLVVTYLWKNCGYNMVLWLAGLDNISGNLYEAARVDGANALQCFLNITLPGILPTAGLVAILSLLNGFKVFREAYLVAGPYPNDSIYQLQHLFNNWFANMDITRLCAAAVLLCVVLLAVILVIQKYLQSAED